MSKTTFFHSDYSPTDMDFKKADILTNLLVEKLNNKRLFYGAVTKHTGVSEIEALNELYNEGLIAEPRKDYEIVLTKEGQRVATKGYTALKIEEHEAKRKEATKNELDLSIKEKQLKQLDFVLRTKWLPLILSTVAIIISVIALVINYFK